MTKEGTIQLTTPLKINGEDYTELTHDIGKITIEDLAEIERERNEMLGPKAGTIFRVAQNDNLMHTLLGMHAIIKCNPKIDINDLKRVEGYDLCQMAMVGLRFSQGRLSRNQTTPKSRKRIRKTIPLFCHRALQRTRYRING